MNLKEVMDEKTFAICGDTLNPEKFAYKIKSGMLEKGYEVYPVGKELSSLNEIGKDIDIVDLCIHPAKGLKLLKECNISYKGVVVQPGAGSEDIYEFLNEKGIPYIDDCLLVGMKLYK